MFNFTGKNALITGASGGIGSDIARALHQQGATLAITGTRAEALEALAKELGERVYPIVCNLSDMAEVDTLIDRASTVMGGVDILVNNAGITKDQLFMRMKDSEWDNVLGVNLTAAFKLSRNVLRGMMKQRFGRIIQITSVVGTTGNPGQGNYCAAKAGLTGMSKALAQEVASRNITVNCVAPGFIATAMTDKLDDKQRSHILSAIPAGAMGCGADIAAAVVYLASSEAGYITGQTLHVNGGMVMV